MKKYLTACKENGDLIDEFNAFEDAVNAIKEYEDTDKENGTYTPDFYEIIEKSHYPIYLDDDCKFDSLADVCEWFGIDASDYNETNGFPLYTSAEDVAKAVIIRNGGIRTGHTISEYDEENDMYIKYEC